MDNAADILQQMLQNDAFSRWLGVEVLHIDIGTCTLRMQVRPEMLNGFGVAHGGITFSLADSAFAFACNSQGRHAVSIHCGIEHTAPVHTGDALTAIATEASLGNTISNYDITVKNQYGAVVALFKGVAYRKSKAWHETT
jgi:acyl-CoA thioesterase